MTGLSTASVTVSDCICGTGSTTAMVQCSPVDSKTFFVTERTTYNTSSGTVMSITNGNVTAQNCEFNNNSSSNLVDLVTVSPTISTSNFRSVDCSFQNSAPNKSGITLTSGSASFTDLRNTYNIATGTGYVVGGTGIRAFGNNSSVQPGSNSNLQVTLTQVPFVTI